MALGEGVSHKKFWIARIAWKGSEVVVLQGEMPTSELGPVCAG